MSSAFELLPAIDLLAGSVVRLTRGDFGRRTSYSDDPVAVARAFASAGARWIHVVDLDGAREGRPRQTEAVSQIVTAVGPATGCQIAGGLRSEGAVASVLETGAARVVLATALLGDPGLATRLVDRFGADRVVAALDVREGAAVGEGWRTGAGGLPVVAALVHLADAGIERFAVTAIDRDGELGGPDLPLIERLVALGRGRVIASGGIGTLDDLLAIRDAGAAGAIVGKALYEGRIDLAAALRTLAT